MLEATEQLLPLVDLLPPEMPAPQHSKCDVWPPARIDTLKALLAEGMSAAEIAAEIGVTRNAVIGKVNRDNLEYLRPPKPVRPPRVRKARPAAKPRVVVHVYRSSGCSGRLVAQPLMQVETFPDDDIPVAQRRTLIELTDSTCHFPVGNPGKSDFFFCGAETEGETYCPHHHDRCTRAA